MEDIKKIRIVSLAGEKDYGIEDSEARQDVPQIVEGAPEELDSFKEAFEAFKEGSEALAGIESRAVAADSLSFQARANVVALDYKTIDGVGDEITIPSATPESAGVMTAEDESKLKNLAEEGKFYDLNAYTSQGVYLIDTGSNEVQNYPIQTPANSVLRLTVTDSYDGNTHVIVQVLNMNNHVGGEGGIYIRSCQNGEWKPWAKLQTNVEVGLIDQAKMDDLTDNGIYSGILSTTGETFVIICINNYAIAQQVGVQHISHLKYSLVVGTGEVKIEKRTRDAYGFWTEWENIGSSSTLPEATVDTIGGVKLGKAKNGRWLAVGNIDSFDGSGLGLRIDSTVFGNMFDGSEGLKLKLHSGSGLTKFLDGLGINIGTTLLGSPSSAIPLCIGTPANLEEFDVFIGNQSPNEVPSIPVNPNQFKLGYLGLELTNPSSATKVTWDSSSNMNDFKTPGVYDIYGERTVKTDNLPITNDGSGHSIAARLTVVASTLQPANNEICVTQFLQLSNRVGGEGATYVRTYNKNNNGMNGWSAWQKQMGMIETYMNGDHYGFGFGKESNGVDSGVGLSYFIDNGIYSGVYVDDKYISGQSNTPSFIETFVLVVINDYAASGQAGLPRHITQLKYAVDAITGQSTVKKRVGTGDKNISWSDWSDIGGGGSQEVDITSLVGDYALTQILASGMLRTNTTYKFDYDVFKVDISKIQNKINSIVGPGSFIAKLTILNFVQNKEVLFKLECTSYVNQITFNGYWYIDDSSPSVYSYYNVTTSL